MLVATFEEEYCTFKILGASWKNQLLEAKHTFFPNIYKAFKYIECANI